MTVATLRTKTKERGRLNSAISAKQASIAWWKIHYEGNIFFRQFYLYGNNNNLCTRYVHLTHSVSQPYFYWNFAFILAFWKGYKVGVMAHLITSSFFLFKIKMSILLYHSQGQSHWLPLKKYNPLGEENCRKPSMKQQKYFLDNKSMCFIFSQVFSVDESKVIFSFFTWFFSKLSRRQQDLKNAWRVFSQGSQKMTKN